VGQVQGVAFRWSAKRQAEALGIAGWVRNRSDGRVEACFEGPEAVVREMVDWCRRGPSGARVDGIEVEWTPDHGEFNGFEIR
jgi:acylphosphatase